MIAYDFVFVWLHLGNDEFPFRAVPRRPGDGQRERAAGPAAATADAHVQGPRDRVHR